MVNPDYLSGLAYLFFKFNRAVDDVETPSRTTDLTIKLFALLAEFAR